MHVILHIIMEQVTFQTLKFCANLTIKIIKSEDQIQKI